MLNDEIKKKNQLKKKKTQVNLQNPLPSHEIEITS